LVLLAVSTQAQADDLYVAISGSNEIYASIEDADCGFFTGNIQVGTRPQGVAVHPDGSRVYVASSGSGTVSVIDTATRSVIATIPVGGSPFGPVGVAVHPDGSRAYAISNIRVSVIDTATNAIVGVVFVLGASNFVAVHPNGTRVYVTTAAGIVAVIDTATNTVVTNIPVGALAFGVAVHPGGGRLYAAATDGVSRGWVSVIDTAANTVATTIPVQGAPVGVAVHPNGSRAYVTNNLNESGVAMPGLLSVIDTASNNVIATLDVGRSPHSVAVNRFQIYVTNQVDGTLSVFSTESNASVAIQPVGLIPAGVATFMAPEPPPIAPGLQVTGIEVTQAIQDVANSVPLVRGRKTFVRAHVKSDGPPVFGVTARLFGVRMLCTLAGCDGSPLGFVIPSNNVGTHIMISDDPNRQNLNDSFLFELPWAWSDLPDPIRLHVLLHTSPGLPPTTCRPDAPSVTSGFEPATTLDIQFIRLAYDLAGVPPSTARVATTVTDQDHNESWVERSYPLSELRARPDLPVYDPGLGSRVDRTAQECLDMKPEDREFCAHRYVTTLPALLNAVGSARGAYALIPEDPAGRSLFTRGACCRQGLGAGPSQGSKYGYYTAHEIGHLLGRRHPVTGSIGCGHTADDPNYPYVLTLIHPLHDYDPETGFAGFDRGDSGLAIGQNYVGNYSAFDVMGYCGPVYWISDYSYNGLYGALRAGAVSTLGMGSLGGAAAESTSSAPQLGDWLTVLGQIGPDPDVSGYIQTRRVDRIDDVPPRTPGNHSIRLVGAGGVALADYPFTAELVEDIEEIGGTPAFSFAQVVPFSAGTQAIQIIDIPAGNRVVAAKAVSPNPPVVADVSLQGPDPGGAAIASWTASDLDGDSLTFDVFFSRDNGATLTPLMLNLTGTSAEIDTASLGGGTAFFRVLATDGVNSVFADTPSFIVAEKPPRPRILAPGADTAIYQGQLLNLEGSATDPQDGVIPDAGLAWAADGRPLGSGPRLSVTDLPIGTSEIVLTATNSAGLSATATVRITVREVIPFPGPTLTAGPGQVGWHVAEGETQVQTAELHVGNSGSGDLGFTAESDAPWLTVLPDAGNAPATLTLFADPRDFEEGMRGEAHVTVTAPGSPDQILTIPVTLSMGNTFQHGAKPFEEVPSCAADVTAQVSVTRGGFRRNFATGRFVQQVTLRNTGSSDLSEIALVLDNLSANAMLQNKSGETACATPVSPYVVVPGGADGVLSPGENASLILEFVNPSNRAISYAVRVLASSENR
jgi:YVTN family beta-propeller protein